MNISSKNHRDLQDLKERSQIAYTNQIKKRSEIDVDWGFNRLLGIASPELKTKMFRLIQLLAQAVSRFDDQKILDYSENMIKGLNILVEYAESRGFEKLNPAIWIVEHPESKAQIILVQNADELSTACAIAGKEKPSFYFTVRELLAVVPEEVFDVKERFKTLGNVEVLSRKPINQADIDGCTPHDEIV